MTNIPFPRDYKYDVCGIAMAHCLSERTVVTVALTHGPTVPNSTSPGPGIHPPIFTPGSLYK